MIKNIYFLLISFFTFPALAQTVDEHIKTDQFGYPSDAQKIAVISNPQTGYNSSSSFTPGSSYEVRRANDHSTVFSGTPVSWNAGATHTQSGDQAWWFDFSSLTTAGTYYILDVTNNVKSYDFKIDDCVYNEVLRQSMRAFYYQRCGVAKAVPYAQTGWTDGACHIGTQQDTDCRLYSNTSPATSKDLSGGWHDAGDYNKYVNFIWGVMIDMLLAYEENPSVWTDDYNIPESGNGTPDLLDEIKVELDWLLKMQNSDGSVLSVVGGGGASPPSADNDHRLYGPATTSATLTAAGIFALAAIQFESIGMTSYAATLETAAINAWTWANANTNVTFRNTDNSLAAGEQEVDSKGRACRKIGAAAFLFALTGNNVYKTAFDTEVGALTNWWYEWYYPYPFEHTVQDAMLYYTKTAGATTALANSIKSRYTNAMRDHNDHYQGYVNETDAYRAYLTDGSYTWGSNRVKSDQAAMFLSMNVYGFDAANSSGYHNAAAGFVHYMHGVNPNSLTYLSNMGAYGAENSINEFYHSWFSEGSALWDRVGVSTYGPAPGFIPGGPNKNYKLDDCCAANSCNWTGLCNSSEVTPPLNQPVQKSYKDWNTSWPQNSWEVTENAQGYQASYIRMLSHFVCTAPPLGSKDHGTDNSSHVTLFPNPTQGNFTVEIELDKNTEVEVIVYNAIGKIIHTSKAAGTAGTYKLDVPFEEHPTGVYFVHVKAGPIKSVERLIKIK